MSSGKMELGKFSVGMAIYDLAPFFSESIRAMFTAMSLQIHHREVGEIIIIDNNPHPANSLRNLPEKTNGVVRYIAFPEPKGTSAPRNQVFREAKFDHVVCMDSHVLLYPGALKAFADFYRVHGWDCPDLLHGPMMKEQTHHVMATHMNDQWRCEMWGTWAWAWEKDNIRFSPYTRDADFGEYLVMDKDTGDQRRMSLETAERLGLPYPLPWSCHEKRLMDLGCTFPADNFPIPGHGMGLFACRKDAWLPFHEDCRGFGGEEMTTGYRFRKAGRRNWCVRQAKWWHHFDRMYGGTTPYQIVTWDRVRNYVLEFLRLGLDVAPIYNHFVLGINGAERNKCPNPIMPTPEWDRILRGMDWPSDLPGIKSRQEEYAKQLRENKPVRSLTKEMGLV